MASPHKLLVAFHQAKSQLRVGGGEIEPTLGMPQPREIRRAAGGTRVVAGENEPHLHPQRHRFGARPSCPVGLPIVSGESHEQSLALVIKSRRSHVGHNELGLCLGLTVSLSSLGLRHQSGLVGDTNLTEKRERMGFQKKTKKKCFFLSPFHGGYPCSRDDFAPWSRLALDCRGLTLERPL